MPRSWGDAIGAARAVPAPHVPQASLSGWLVGERAPVAAPGPPWDRLLYRLDDVETYLRSRAPRDLLSTAGSRLPETET